MMKWSGNVQKGLMLQNWWQGGEGERETGMMREEKKAHKQKPEKLEQAMTMWSQVRTMKHATV